MFGVNQREGLIAVEAGAEVEAVDARDAMTADLIEQALDPERARNGADEARQQHARQTHHVDDELQLVRLVHPHAGGVNAREFRHMLGEEAELHVLHAADVAGAHRHHLRSDGKHVARLCQRQHILLHQLRRAFPHLDEVRLDGIALVTAAVPARQDATLKIYDTVFFPALLRQITGFRCHVVFLLALRRK